MRLFRMFVLIAPVITLCLPVHALSIVDIPRPNDTTSPELLRFVEIRNEGEVRNHALRFLGEEAYRGQRVDAHEHYRKVDELVAAGRIRPFDADDEALILGVLERELDSETPDWEPIEWALIASVYGRLPDTGLVPLIRRVLEFPRGEKISSSHGNSLSNGISALRHAGTESARSLLAEAEEEGFWIAGGPARTPVLSTDAGESLRRLQSASSLALEPSPQHPDGSKMLARPHMADSLPSVGSGNVWETLVKHRENCESSVEQEFSRLATEIIYEPLDGLTREEMLYRLEKARGTKESERLFREPSGKLTFTGIVRRLEQARVSSVSEQVLEYALQCIRHELDTAELDWAIVDEALRICFHAGSLPEDTVDLLREIFVYPRDADQSEDHAEALWIGLSVTGRVGTQAALDLLLQANSEAFWQAGGPVRRPARIRLPETVDPLDTIRTAALLAIAYVPAPLSRGVLEEIREDHAFWAGSMGTGRTYEHNAHHSAMGALYFLDLWHPETGADEEEN